MQYIGGLSLLLAAVILYRYVRDRKIGGERGRRDAQTIEDLQSQVERLKSRHMTASGGLSRDVKDELGNIIAKIDMMGDPIDELKARHEDLRREVIKLMNSKRR